MLNLQSFCGISPLTRKASQPSWISLNFGNAMSASLDQRLVFLSFKSEEKAHADQLHRALTAKGYNVWWQQKLQCGHVWHADIDAALQAAGCVVVLWSPASLASEWVKHEASQAIARHVYAPVRIVATKIDAPFDRVQATDLIDWDGTESHAGFQNLLRRLEELLPPSLTPFKVAGRFLKWHAFATGLLAFALISVTMLLRLGAFAQEQIEAQHRAAEQLKSSEMSLASLIATTKMLLEPELRFTYVLGIGPQSSGHFSIENSGGGMATIKAIRASVNGREIKTDAASLSEAGRQYGLVGHTLKVGETIGPGRAAKIFDIPAKEIPNQWICREDKERRRFFERLQLEIDYTSLLGAMKTQKHEYKSTNNQSC